MQVAALEPTATALVEIKESQGLLREQQRRLEADLADARMLQSISTELIRENDVQALYEKIVDAAVSIMGSQFASMQMLYSKRGLPGSGGELKLLAFRGFNADAARTWQWVDADHSSSCGMTLRTRRRCIVPDVEACDFMAGSADLSTFRSTGIRSVQTTPLFSRSGELVGMTSTHWSEVHEPSPRDLRLFDILARQAADLIEHGRARAALEEADRRKDEFLAMLAHELRNPLASIDNALQIVQLPGTDAAAIRTACSTMQRQVAQITRLVHDLLDVDRIARGKIELRKERVELRAVLNDAMEAAQPVCRRMGHVIDADLPEDDVFVDGDRSRLTQVFSNLLDNGCKFTPEGGRIRLSLEVLAAWTSSAQALVSVRDEGIGIAPADIGRVFDRFVQIGTPPGRTASGLGVGLTLVKRLVEQHGGTVEARSDGRGHGSTFVVRLPVLADARPEAPSGACGDARETD